MIEPNRVLCPIDLSEASAQAFDDAVDFARWDEPRLTGLHGRPGLPRWLLGCVTEELLQRTGPCPLPVLPPHADEAPPPKPVPRASDAAGEPAAG